MNRIGIDVGSKTVKLVVIDEEGEVIHAVYRPHGSNIHRTLVDVIDEYIKRYGSDSGYVAVTGSGGISVARMLELPFVQEVTATTIAVQNIIPQADAIIELGGEDAKVVYLDGVIEQRMNTTCAGGTGGFIDSIASMLGIFTRDLNMFAQRSQRTYPLASRCAVFAQSDVRSLQNLGVSREDIAASALEAVVKQTMGGLACGRPIRGNVVFLGGPFEYLPNLYKRFCSALGLEKDAGIRPQKAHLYTVRGAAIYAGEHAQEQLSAGAQEAGNLFSLSQLSAIASKGRLDETGLGRLEPLFATAQERREFDLRHAPADVPRVAVTELSGPLYIGIDAGASAVKIAAVDEQGRLFASLSRECKGDALAVAAELLEVIYGMLPKGERVYVAQAAATGSGDETIQTALRVDSNVVETLAHARAAQWLDEDVSFVVDAGGQDIKALWVREGEIYDTALNEPCSSGCGIFMEETTAALKMPLNRFTEEACKAPSPVELDTKCIVFMNSRVRHAQKVGATRSDIAAGLAYSIALNAYQRVIGASGTRDFGDHVVVQGGLFASDAVLRAFEKVSGLSCTRPANPACAGAIGAALIARDRAHEAMAAGAQQVRSTIATPEELVDFDPIYSTFTCTGCENACVLSIVSYSRTNIYVSGNRCPKGAQIVRDESIQLSQHDILGSSSQLPRLNGSKKRRHVSEIGNGIVIPGYLRSFSGGMLGGGNTVGIAEEPRRVDYQAIQLERDRTRERKVKLIAPTKYLSAEEVARKKLEEAKSEERRRQEEEAARKELEDRIKNLKVTSSARTLRSEATGVPNMVADERAALAAFGDVSGRGERAGITVGIVNTLDTYARVPFWHTLLAELGYGVMVPDLQRSKRFALTAAESVPSESVCDPAKVSHGRIYEMMDRGATAVLMPGLERKGRCPVLCGYAEAVRDNVPFFFDGSVPFATPLLSCEDTSGIVDCQQDVEAVLAALQQFDAATAPDTQELLAALKAAVAAQQRFMEGAGESARRALAWIAEQEDRRGILLACRPYHTDEELLHDVDNKLACMGYAVLSPLGAEVLAGGMQPEQGASEQAREWGPGKRLERYAGLALDNPKLDIVFLHSFNCGYDSTSIRDVRLQLLAAGRTPAVIRLDEMADTAHVDVQLRTLAESAPRDEERTDAPGTDPIGTCRSDRRDALLSVRSTTEAFGAPDADSTNADEFTAPRADSINVDSSNACRSDRRDALLSVRSATEAAGAPDACGSFAPGDAATCDDVLANGIQPGDVETARLVAPVDTCFTAAAMLARATDRLEQDPSISRVSLPNVCSGCLTCSLPRALEREVGHPVEVEWNAAWDEGLLQLASADASASRPGAPAIGIVGNPLLCYDSFMNEGIVGLLQELGARPVLPSPELMQVDDVRYLPQLEQFEREGVNSVLYLQNFSCLKGHVQARGALHGLQERFPNMPITVLDYDPESSALNRENRVRLVVSAAKQRVRK